MAELRNNYSSVDYSHLTKDNDEYQKISLAVKDSMQGKKKVKVKVTSK